MVKFQIQSYIIPFVMAGLTVTAVKFAATQLDNPGLAAILGGIPMGLAAMVFLTSDKAIPYAQNYFYVTLILATSILAFYLLHIHTSISKNILVAAALVMWLLLAIGHYFVAKYLDKK